MKKTPLMIVLISAFALSACIFDSSDAPIIEPTHHGGTPGGTPVTPPPPSPLPPIGKMVLMETKDNGSGVMVSNIGAPQDMEVKGIQYTGDEVSELKVDLAGKILTLKNLHIHAQEKKWGKDISSDTEGLGSGEKTWLFGGRPSELHKAARLFALKNTATGDDSFFFAGSPTTDMPASGSIVYQGQVHSSAINKTGSKNVYGGGRFQLTYDAGAKTLKGKLYGVGYRNDEGYKGWADIGIDGTVDENRFSGSATVDPFLKLNSYQDGNVYGAFFGAGAEEMAGLAQGGKKRTKADGVDDEAQWGAGFIGTKATAAYDIPDAAETPGVGGRVDRKTTTGSPDLVDIDDSKNLGVGHYRYYLYSTGGYLDGLLIDLGKDALGKDQKIVLNNVLMYAYDVASGGTTEKEYPSYAWQAVNLDKAKHKLSQLGDGAYKYQDVGLFRLENTDTQDKTWFYAGSPTQDMPASGEINYAGKAHTHAIIDNDTGKEQSGVADFSLKYNAGTKAVTGTIKDVLYHNGSLPDQKATITLSGGASGNTFSGTAAIDAAMGAANYQNGDVKGAFFGKGAHEVAGVAKGGEKSTGGDFKPQWSAAFIGAKQ